MIKWPLIPLIIIAMASSVLGICCERSEDCIITETCQEGDCGNCTITIYNDDGIVAIPLIGMTEETAYFYSYNASQNLTEYISYPYVINCTGGQVCEGDCQADIKQDCGGGHLQMIIGLMIIPVALCFLFLYFAHTLPEEQQALKWFMRILSLFIVFVVYVAGHIVSTQYGFAEFEALYNIAAFTWVFYTVFGVLLIYFLYRIFIGFYHKKQDEFNRGVI